MCEVVVDAHWMYNEPGRCQVSRPRFLSVTVVPWPLLLGGASFLVSLTLLEPLIQIGGRSWPPQDLTTNTQTRLVGQSSELRTRTSPVSIKQRRE